MADGRAGRARKICHDLGVIGLSGALWIAAIYVNNQMLFPRPEEDEFDRWVFVPAGLRMLLVMLFGWRAAVGTALGSIPWMFDVLPGVGLATIAVSAGISGLMPWISVQLFSGATGVRHPWHDLVWWHLPAIAALSAFANSLALNSQFLMLGREPPRELAANLLSMMIGDFLGALVLLLALVAVVRLLRAGTTAR